MLTNQSAGFSHLIDEHLRAHLFNIPLTSYLKSTTTYLCYNSLISLSAIYVHYKIKFKTRAERELDAHPFNNKAATDIKATTSAITGQQSELCQENLLFSQW